MLCFNRGKTVIVFYDYLDGAPVIDTRITYQIIIALLRIIAPDLSFEKYII